MLELVEVMVIKLLKWACNMQIPLVISNKSLLWEMPEEILKNKLNIKEGDLNVLNSRE